jgi:dCTP deaminase
MANYDLVLGEDVYVTTEKVPTKLNAMGKDGVVSIEPGEFGILMTYEYIFVPPDLMGFISVRLTHKQKGLVNISGFHVDPGFYGRLMFAVFNAGPNDVPLRYKERVFMIMFNELTGGGPIVKQRRWSGMESIPVETLSGLRGTSVSVRNLDERIKRLEMVFPIMVTGVVSVVVAVITWVLTHW